jgi:ribonuclease-3
MTIQQIQQQFKNPSLFTQALVHRSHLNENHDFEQSNERLEFLGDAILEAWISGYLFNKFPQYQEGDLTNLRALTVCTANLSSIAYGLKIGQLINLSRGEEKHGGRENPSILADTFESIIGALYLDQGFKKTSDWLELIFKDNIEKISQQKNFKDPKSHFQEIAQSITGITPNYKTLKEEGPDHHKLFQVGVYLNDKLIATGTGPSKQKAEEEASIEATKKADHLV